MMNERPRGPFDNEVGAVRKALQILCEFSTTSPILGASQVSRRLGIPKSTAHNLLRTLESLDFLKQDPGDRRYRLGPRVYELGLHFSQTTHLVSAALPQLRLLADQTRETVKLAVRSGDEILIMAAIESPYQLHTRGDEGMRAPLHCTGLGKAILAILPPAEVRQIVARHGLRKYTPHTIATPEGLTQELDRIRASGYSLDVEEHEAGVVCVAAAIRARADGVLPALSVSAPSSRLQGERIGECVRQVIEAARAVERALGSGRRERNKET